VRDLRLAEEGVRRIEWAAREMPVIAQIRKWGHRHLGEAAPAREMMIAAE